LFIYANPIKEVLPGTPDVQKYFFPRLEIHHHELPVEVPDFYVRLRPKIVGICGSDVHMVQKEPNSGQIVSSIPMSIPSYGRILGHEGLCQVSGVGKGVNGYSPGDWVVPSSIYHCGTCQVCIDGALNQCVNSQLLGSQIDGLFATEVDIHKNLLFNVSPFALDLNTPFTLSALEPLATALQALQTARRNNSTRILILGAGPIGSFTALIAKYAYKYTDIVVIEPIQRRRELVEPFCTATYPTLADYLASRSSDITFHTVIEACGDLRAIDQILNLMHPKGVLTLMGRTGQPLKLQTVDLLITKAIQIQGCRGQLGGYMEKAARILTENKLPLNNFIHLEEGGLPKLREYLNNSDTLTLNYCKVSISL
jgi:threonine dehydrogenase-like Zn-dependent dehydrogenase